MNKYKIVTSGVDSEYVLGNLAKYLTVRNYEVIELDFAKFNSDKKQLLLNLRNENVIYITSAHTNLTLSLASHLAPSFAKYYPHYLAPIEIIPLLKPKLSIYIPHDLLTPYGDTNLAETRFLDLFDHILTTTPQDQKILSALLPETTKIHFGGWAKYTSQPAQHNKIIKVMLFISMFEHLKCKYGITGLVDYIRPLLSNDVAVKIPLWNDSDKVEELIKSQSQAEVIPASVNSISLIERAEIVVCNGASSIHAESALMGKPTICILDEEGTSIAGQMQKLRHLPNMFFHNYEKKETIPESMIHSIRPLQGERILKPFNYELIMKIINSTETLINPSISYNTLISSLS